MASIPLRSPNPQCVRETFAWAAGFGYCSFLSSAAKASDAWPPAAREALLNGRQAWGGGGVVCQCFRGWRPWDGRLGVLGLLGILVAPSF